ncbi:hypothetical protein NPIL_323811 [Nephila pilipes]|uniref:Uncharacterized protein n=1 Tax=Nephila pilipes TaxID=299642 RepID=A0A8X6PRV7_NEPPI|nr:hypothetical protein NPIL_323811 [Nephila pilipes]
MNRKDAARKGGIDGEVEELTFKIGCSWSSVKNQLRPIRKLYRYETWVPHELMETALDQLHTICGSLLSWYESDPFW